MNLPLARLGAEPESAGNRRREPRFNAVFNVSVINMMSKTAPALLVDISLHGACIRSDAPWLRIGSFIKIAIADDDRLEGVVRWMRDGAVGLEFLSPVGNDRETWLALMESGSF